MCKTHFFWVLLALGMSSCLEKKPEVKQLSSPNVLFIAVDDLRPDLGVYGNSVMKTPHMDALAKSGALFRNHFVQVPTCGASRHSMLTGLRPANREELTNAIFEKKSQNPNQPESFIQQFRDNGYHTVGIGKISHSADGLVYGYTEAPTEKRELPNSWDELLFNPGKWETGWNAFFAYANGENRQSMKRQVKPYEAGEVDDQGYPDGLTAQLAVEKLKKLQGSEKPFFMGVGFFKPHLPFTAPKKYWDLYDEATLETAPNPFVPKNVNKASLHGSGELNGYRLTDEKAGLDKSLSPQYSKKLIHAYYAAISYVDAQVGQVLNTLEKLGMADNTIVVVWGDHGWHLGHHNVWGKHTLFDVALQSTLIVKDPRVEKKREIVSHIVESVDIYPTLMELCDIDPKTPLDGESLAGLMTGNQTDREKGVAYSYFKKGISLRTEQYRLTQYFREEEPVIELYDHKKDPFETENIAEENRTVVSELMPLLEVGNTKLYDK